jgi:hypothetical protein
LLDELQRSAVTACKTKEYDLLRLVRGDFDPVAASIREKIPQDLN